MSQRTASRKSEDREFTERVIEINRVTRVVKGGKRMRFRALLVIGDNKSKISWGMGKAADVSTAIAKASTDAKKRIISIYLYGTTIPYPIRHSYKGAEVLLKPASPGTGIIAGGAIRTVLQLAGVKDAVAKMLGSHGKISNTLATIQALHLLTDPAKLRAMRGIGRPSKSTIKQK